MPALPALPALGLTPTSPRRRRTRAAAMMSVGALLATAGAASLVPSTATASSHREAPMIAGLPQYDNTDVYAFVSPDNADTVTFVANWIPFEEPAGGPNFYAWATDAAYDLHVDNDGDAVAELTYRFEFTDRYRNLDTFLYNTGVVTELRDPDLNFRQTYNVSVQEDGRWRRLGTNLLVAPSYVGDVSMPNYEELRDGAVSRLPRARGQVFAGQADDSFFLDLRVFDLLYGPVPGVDGNNQMTEVGNDTLAGYNVNTIALQLPISELTDGEDVIGTWSTTSRKDADGEYQQVSRLGNPLVNEVVIPLRDKNNFNASEPVDDPQFLEYVTEPELPQLIEAIYGIPAPAEPRDDLVSVFLTGLEGLNQPENLTAPGEMIRLNTAIAPSPNPDRLGVIGGDTAGFPNGRRLIDDVVDIELQVLMGELLDNPNDLGDAVNVNDKDFGTTFPYVALPHSGSESVNDNGGSNVGAGFTLPNGGIAPDSQPWTSGLPVTQVSLVAAGLMLLMAGLVTARRRVGPQEATA